jgi:F-box/WD-40 domain protein MET30
MATHTTHTMDVATDHEISQASSCTSASKRRRPTSTCTNPHTALMQAHNHEGLSERTRYLHGDTIDDTDERKSKKIGKMIQPYLAQHIPQQYNPIGGVGEHATGPTANTKYCYRHRPDLLCRQPADEPSMEQLQVVSIFSLQK